MQQTLDAQFELLPGHGVAAFAQVDAVLGQEVVDDQARLREDLVPVDFFAAGRRDLVLAVLAALFVDDVRAWGGVASEVVEPALAAARIAAANASGFGPLSQSSSAACRPAIENMCATDAACTIAFSDTLSARICSSAGPSVIARNSSLLIDGSLPIAMPTISSRSLIASR